MLSGRVGLGPAILMVGKLNSTVDVRRSKNGGGETKTIAVINFIAKNGIGAWTS